MQSVAARSTTSFHTKLSRQSQTRGVCVAATHQSKEGGVTKDASLEKRTEQVKAILKKEHEHHGQGKPMFLHVEGRGRRMTVGHDVDHVGNLSGLSVQSIDYSLFN